FGAVIPKWGGIAEIAQVACRAGAVGGGVYVLNKGVEEIKFKPSDGLPGDDENGGHEPYMPTLQLQGGEAIKTNWLAGRHHDLSSYTPSSPDLGDSFITRMISIVSSPLVKLFPNIAGGTPSPSGTVVVFPPGTISDVSADPITEVPPVHMIIHSSDTGECPMGQWQSILESAIQGLLGAIGEEPRPSVLWSLRYSQQKSSVEDNIPNPMESEASVPSKVLLLSDPSTDLVFDDRILERVRTTWQTVTGESDGFMQFEDREIGAYDDDQT
ncbi:MAG: hypothetical protein Q9187_008292, partial [Circinaria calcarea]